MRASSVLGLFLVGIAACGGGTSTPTCGAGQLLCPGNVCVNVLASDPNNCGGCGITCSGTDACQAGVCVATSPFQHLGQPGGPVPTGAPVYRVQAGAGIVVQPGVQAGYGITANSGGSFRLIWTGDAATSGGYHEFFGAVYTTGAFGGVVPGCAGNACALQADDDVEMPVTAPGGGQRIDFDSFSSDSNLDGFDFTVNSDPFFDLYIDGTHYPTLVFFAATANGGAQSNVGAIPFGLTLQ